ncbi:unnamed protein product, partial [Vitis vinifera]|uniref:Uncharacterized protein n=1 Tax=Vitis vinifera TaxID=29760 RepID=D7TZG8_VITVI
MVGSVALNSLSLSSLRRKVRNFATPTSSFSASTPLLSPWRAQDSNLNPKPSRPAEAAEAEEAAIPTPRSSSSGWSETRFSHNPISSPPTNCSSTAFSFPSTSFATTLFFHGRAKLH